jgi:hypothetical protein
MKIKQAGKEAYIRRMFQKKVKPVKVTAMSLSIKKMN